MTEEYTTIEYINQIHKSLLETFLRASVPSLVPDPTTASTSPFPLLSVPYRVHQLHQLARALKENADAFCDALYLDLGKPRQEVIMAEVGPLISRTLATAEGVGKWAAVKDAEGVPDWQSTWGARTQKRAKGVVLIISPWNYPLVLSVQPLIGAIAAGCPAVVKPSEVAPHFSSLLARLVSQYLDPASYRVVLGAVPEITRLLELKWDHIFYTGNGRIGRIIAGAAAKHLTPLTLELGGKSPVIVDADTCGDLELAAKRIIWGKCNNAGQICIAPDYVLVQSTSVDAFVEGVRKALNTMYPDGALASPSYGRIVSPLHFNRVKSLLSQTKGRIALGSNVGPGGENAEDRGVEPTVVVFESLEEAKDDVLMQEELFAPILPVVGVQGVSEAVAYVRGRDHPLVLYAFTEDKEVQNAIGEATLSGSLIFNDTFQQLSVDQIPFGGVGESGYGRQIGEWTFDEFTYHRAILDIPQNVEFMLGVRYPPATDESMRFFSQALQAPIPETAGDSDGAVGNGTAGN